MRLQRHSLPLFYRLRCTLAPATITIAALLCSACQQQRQTEIRLSGEAQGSYYSIIYFDNQHRNLQHDIDSLLHDFDLTASLWEPESLIRRINDNRDSIANTLFADLLNKSNEINLLTDGCYDCTVGKLVKAWGFGFEKSTEMTPQRVDSLRRYCGKPATLNRGADGITTVRKPSPETEIDFNAIAQGYSVDLVGRYLEHKGIGNYIIDIGGEVLAKGCKADSTHWTIGIERPSAQRYSSREIETVITLRDRAVVTSGNYRKYYEKDGLRYSHTIDPSTGYPVKHTLLSVSVVDTTAWRADALATAFMVMGLQQSLQFLEAHGDEIGVDAVFFIYNENGNYKTYATPAFAELVAK